MNTISEQQLLNALVHAVNLKSVYATSFSGRGVKAIPANIKKLVRLAEAAKYAGKHLVIELREYAEGNELHLELETNTDETYTRPYTLFNFEYDLISLDHSNRALLYLDDED